jgi:hypothetical protein
VTGWLRRPKNGRRSSVLLYRRHKSVQRFGSSPCMRSTRTSHKTKWRNSILTVLSPHFQRDSPKKASLARNKKVRLGVLSPQFQRYSPESASLARNKKVRLGRRFHRLLPATVSCRQTIRRCSRCRPTHVLFSSSASQTPHPSCVLTEYCTYW